MGVPLENDKNLLNEEPINNIISIEVPKDYKKSKWLCDATPGEVENVLLIGEEVVKRIDKFLMYKSDENDENYDPKIERAYTGFNEILRKIANDNSEFKEKLNKLVDQLEGKGKPIDAGNMGEEIVKNWLKNEYHDCELIDTSRIGHSGDMLFKWNSLNLLIEVKNKDKVTNEDIEKFKTDMNFNSDSNAGIFISLRSENIPKKGEFKYETEGNKPVIYIATPSKEHIFLLIKIFEFSIKRKNEDFENNDEYREKRTEAIIKQINNCYNTYHSQIAYLSTMKKNIKMLETSIRNIEEKTNKDIGNISSLMDDFTDIALALQIKSAVEKIADFYQAKGTMSSPNQRRTMKISEKEEKDAGGIVKLNKDARNLVEQRKLEDEISSIDAKKLVEQQNENLNR